MRAEAGEFAELNPLPCIAHRKVLTRYLKNGLWVHTSEFAIPTALTAIKPLSAIVKSKDPAARRISARLAKTAAILMLMNSDREVFKMYASHYNKRELAAFAK